MRLHAKGHRMVDCRTSKYEGEERGATEAAKLRFCAGEVHRAGQANLRPRYFFRCFAFGYVLE
jgi:hypothetical protein